MARDIEIYINKIVLDGYDHLDGKALKRAVEEHLTQMIQEQGILSQQGHSQQIRRINGGTLSLGPTQKTAETGRGIASGIFQAVQGNNSHAEE